MGNGGSYWDSVLLRRLSRRRALQMAAVGGASAGAIALVGCGGDDDEDGGGAAPTTAPGGTSEGTPKPGGTLRITLPIVTGIDPRKAATFIPHALGSHSYSRLMRFKTTVGVLPQEDRYAPVPELAAKIENPDPLTYIITLRDDAKFHNVPPMDGRAVVAEDVVYAFESYRELSPNKGNFDIVDSLTASATNQVTFKLKEPFGLFLHRLASYQDLWIIPKEFIDSGERAADERTVGSGPFVFDKLEAGVQYTWKKNPDYFEKDADGAALPYLDGVALRVITDVNQVLSQFAAGQLDTIFVPANLVDSLRGQSPDATFDEAPRNILNFLYFEPASYTENKPPFNDERVRRGFSRGLDRDALLDVASPGGGKWPNMPINPGFSEFWWLDPQGSDIGAAGDNYKYDPAEARALFSAAGVSDIEVPMHFASNVYTIVVPYYETIRQVIPNMLKESGVTVKEVPEEYSGVYIPKTFAGEFDGFALGLESVFSDVAAYWTNMFYPRDAGGGRNHSSVNDADLQAKIKKMVQEQDVDEIRSQNFDLQKELSQKMYYVPVINPVEYTARQKNLRGVVNTQGPTTYAIGTEGSLTVWFES